MSKTWTAIDVRMRKLTIRLVGSVLILERRYVFVDAEFNELTQVAGGRVREEIELSVIPQNILDALQTIDAWTKAKALEQEGM